MLNIALQCSLLIFVYANFWFAISVLKKRNDIADIAWGLGYIVTCLFLIFTQETSKLAFVVYALICIWGLRLSIHIYARNKNKPEDFRYNKWRNEWKEFFFIRSYFQVFILQGIIMLIVISPVFLLGSTKLTEIPELSYFGILFWILGFSFQSIADYQLQKFVATKSGGIMQSGLWRYSRHPNYFGEILMWWGIFMTILPIENSIYFIVSPLLITYLLVYVSGIPLLEARYKNSEDYKEYKTKTSLLIPWKRKS